MAKEPFSRRGGVEGRLDGVGTFYLGLCIIAFILCLVGAGTNEKTGLSPLFIGVGIGALAQGIVFWIFFQGAAEVIRLLKKLNGLPYGGRILGTLITGIDKSYYCSDCDSPVSIADKVCTQCGADLEHESSS